MRIVTRVFIAIFLYFLLIDIVQAEPYSTRLCRDDSHFYCYRIKGGDSWNKLFSVPEQRNLVMRLNRMNIELERGMRIAVPKNLDNTDIMAYSPFSQEISPPGQKIIIVSLKNLAFGAYNADGSLEFWGPASGGRGYCPDLHRGCHTSLGTFSIYQKEGRGCVSTKFPVGKGGAPMPYCMFFNGGFALHGSYEVPGFNASHGCVRLFVNDAQWLNQEFTADQRRVPVIIRN